LLYDFDVFLERIFALWYVGQMVGDDRWEAVELLVYLRTGGGE
jgi:hypothetical protein